jgi:hypothetical protein
VLVGEGITLTVTTVGEAPVSFQWMFNGVAIQGATDSVLQLSGLREN